MGRGRAFLPTSSLTPSPDATNQISHILQGVNPDRADTPNSLLLLFSYIERQHGL
jgi:hypothetical protein